jgi:two-component system, chemotaxis family, chemotaxis protein CheY
MVASQRTVVLVEDDDDHRSVVSEVLVDEGYRTISVRNGLEALEALQTISPPCVVVADLVMPRMDGQALTDAIRADARIRDVPVIMMTGLSGAPIQGANAVLAKPVSLDALLAAIDEQLGPAASE